MLYGKEALEACRQVLNDVIYYLAEYENKFYLIGGWAVYYLLDRPDRSPEAIGFAGTEDVDLAFLVPMAELERIMKRLEKHGYQRSSSQRMRREVSGRTVIVDLLGGKQEVRDTFTFKRRISGPTLGGENIDAEISIANLPACLVLKAQAFDENPKDKDAYDVYYLVARRGQRRRRSFGSEEGSWTSVCRGGCEDSPHIFWKGRGEGAQSCHTNAEPPRRQTGC